ncbi:MAG: hypothetical protein JW967_03835 [Dehalococcoidales bacterium]|nr:hypothetical protein [Dehalococcoidales bacterium]
MVAYIHSFKDQVWLLPPSIEELYRSRALECGYVRSAKATYNEARD